MPSRSKIYARPTNPGTRPCIWVYESRHTIMHSIFFTFMVLLVNILIIPLTVSDQVDKRTPHDFGSRPSDVDPSSPYPKAHPHSPSSHSNPPRRRNTRRDGKSCQQRPDNSNPLRNPYELANPSLNLPFLRTPFVESDERYCPKYQYAVCDSGVDSERVLRVESGKWRLWNCNRCE